MTQNNQWIKQLNYIIWDLDGTLYEITDELYETIRFNVYQAVANLKNISIEDAKTIYDDLYDCLNSNGLVLESLGVNLSDSEKMFNETQLAAIKKDEELVDKLYQLSDFEHIICTNSPLNYTLMKLEKIGFKLDFFKKIVSAPDMVGELKPAIEPYQYLLDFTQAQPQQHLFVGDRYATDLETAEKIGMHTALVHTDDERADLVFPSSSKLANYLLDVVTQD